MRALIAYLSYSGNTEEIAEIIADKLVADGMEVEMHSIGIDPPIDPSRYDYFFFGTFTWDVGSTPDEMKDFVLEVGYKPDNVAVFGSGDTQFGGDDLFCRAVDRLAKFYNSKWEGLKIEQSPRGSQEALVEQWVEGVLHDVKSLA
ncbi:flavodoxin [Cerasibacillus quisquiliarum]|uniref:Flavodoxin n=1 Tax=Cerasibacillus quisquiliarum TaxID=227865 RepID=A0A511UW25_9BACI|nr:flavodoxin [Cerasibacillus quisquiliarum]GEN30815.1 flavodoxin [Cerasibacillus quisquiliarum]